ncbi:MAG TPA: response regulator transcription factor [Candidatus Egerieimonas intestinavium]|uniref:Stage 0 sporulation protein A homolog n=1 Tax=Candidatus Egerieimonas intestinavium TaxID=2840777 RepID=A0A9D1EMF7_9FIRM|nr:response regulator transcription factor [Candidatus Egerieimonas intestinavium]
MKIIVIDDDSFICLSLKTILQADPEITVSATGTSGQEAIALYRRLHPDILLMDIQMPGMSGLEAGELILQEDPRAKLLFLTTFSDNDYIIQALRIGAKGYLIKQNIDSIAPALKAVLAGQSVFGTEISAKLPDLMSAPAGPSLSSLGLSQREFSILEQVAQGLNNREIADALFLSEGTVRNYLSVILDKLQLRDRTQLAIYYYKNFPQGPKNPAP